MVVNATPLIALSLLNQLTIFRSLYNEIMVPLAVYSAVLAGGPHTLPASTHRADDDDIRNLDDALPKLLLRFNVNVV